MKIRMLLLLLVATLVPTWALAGATTDLAELPCNYPVVAFSHSGANALGGAGAAVVNGSPQTAPAATVVMADTGQLAPGCYVIAVTAVNQTDTAANAVQLAHRNAANNADLSTTAGLPVAVIATGGTAQSNGLYQVQIATQNERVVARLLAAATSAKIWQVDMALFPCQ
ncbi:MAG: hypothetical protein WA459_00180 [Stellaceae bacterium]